MKLEKANILAAEKEKEERKYTKEEELEIALKTAARLNHKCMYYMIESRLKGEKATIYNIREERPQPGVEGDNNVSDTTPTAALALGSPQKFGTDSITI